MRVAVITVGDEILAGDITDTNAAWLGGRLTERGTRVERMITVPDDHDDIADVVRETSAAFDAVVVTGGLGPTHDDVTMAAVAAAFGREIGEHPEAIAWFEDHEYHAYAELAEGTTHLPAGARLLPNDEGVAPGAVVENVYVLPGVPDEMKAMFERIAGEFSGTKRHVEFLHADEPESRLAAPLRTVEETFDVQVGSYPGDSVRIKVQGEEVETVRAAADWLRDRVETAEDD